MPEAPARLAPLAGLADPGVAGIAERALFAHVNLRGDPDDARFVAAVREATGLDVPRVPNGTAQKVGTGPGFPAEKRGPSPVFALQLAWLGPDEWLLSAPPEQGAPLLAALNTAFAGLHATATDLSDAYTVIVLECGDAAEILSADCPLDFHERVFAVGACAQSVIGKSNVLIVREATERFAVTVRRSFAGYLHALLCHSALLGRAARELLPPNDS